MVIEEEALPVNGYDVKCGSCKQGWPLKREVSDHEQQSLEAKACPHCGALTLRCQHVGKKQKTVRMVFNQKQVTTTSIARAA